MKMEDHQYGMADLRQLMNGGGVRPHFPGIPPQPAAAADLFSSAGHHHRGLASGQPPPPPPQTYHEMLMMGRQVPPEILQPRGLQLHHHDFRSSDSPAANSTSVTAAAATSSFSGGGGGCLEAETAACLGADGGTGRWPRQETLTLLEIRSRLDFKFKEANQKGPLWDEVSRIMSEEHGYQRSGKKCREKFENLYKYYKKTKEGKAGRQDGKHYRFFRQLEALYGDATNSVSIQDAHYAAANTGGSGFRFHTSLPAQANHQEPYNQSSKSLSLSNNSSEFDSTSSEENNELMVMDNESSEKRNSRKRRGGGGRNWKAKIKEFIDSQMRKLMEKQEAWLEKLMGNLEERERERNVREEEWRREEAARIEREHRFWAKERAWIEARDSALMEALHKLTGKEIKLESSPPHHHHNNEERSEMLSKAPAPEEDETWEELEIARLIQLRASLESRFGGGFSEEVLWEDIAEKMGQMGYERSALMCKDKWESISTYTCNKTAKEFIKKGKDNSRACVGYFRNNESTSSLYNHGGGGGAYCELNEQGGHANNDASSSSPSNPNLGNAVHDPCFPFLMSEGDNLWENYGLKLNKGGQNQ